MSLDWARRIAAHATAGFAFAAAAQGGELPAAVVALFAFAFLASLAFGERLGEGRGGLFTALAALAFAGLVGAWLTGAIDLVVAATSFATALAANRLLSRQSAADDGLLYLSSLLMLAGGAALTADLWYGALFALFSLSATSALTLSHLSRSAQEAQATRRQADALASRRLLGGLFALSGLGLAGAIGVFFAFPRFTTGVWVRGRGEPARGAASGFSGAIRLGGAGPLKSDPRIVAHAALRPDPGLDRLGLLWKGRSLDRFDGRNWSSTAGAAQARRLWELAAGAGDPVALEIEVLGSAMGVAFVPEGAQAIWNPHRVPASPASAGLPSLQLLRDSAGDLRLAPAPGGPYGYSVSARLSVRPEVAGRGTSYPRALTEGLLQLPGLDPRIQALADRWTTGLSDPYDKARAVERELLRFRYAAELPGTAADPLADFLFERKEGHCELFSTAMTVLLRASGVPARAATGFFGGERIGPGLYALRAGDAHAWTEVYFPGIGFVPFDATPSAGRSASPPRASAFLADLVDRAESFWRTTVVDYGLSDQLRAASAALHSLGRGLERLQGRGGPGLVLPLRLLAAAAALGLATWAARSLWRGRATARSPLAGVGPDVALYRALLRRLARRGLAKRAGQTPREFAARLAADHRGEAAEVAAITERYLASRFGGVQISRDELRALRRRVRAL